MNDSSCPVFTKLRTVLDTSVLLFFVCLGVSKCWYKRSLVCQLWSVVGKHVLVQEACQKIVSAAQGVYTKVVPLADAHKIYGLRAVFGEVRAVPPLRW